MGELTISLEGVRLFGRHGVFEHERRDGNDFEINLVVKFIPESISLDEDSESLSTGFSDELEDTISYVILFDIVKEEMDKTRNLIETVARSIAERIKADFPFTSFIECKITKIKPPIPGFSGTASAAYTLRD